MISGIHEGKVVIALFLAATIFEAAILSLSFLLLQLSLLSKLFLIYFLNL